MTERTIDELARAMGATRARRGRVEGYRHLSSSVIRALGTGVPMTEDDLENLASSVSSPPAAVPFVRRASEWQDGAIVGFGGLTQRETSHRLDFDDISLFSWCAWDTLFLVPILGRTAVVHSVTPGNGEPVEVTITPDGVTSKKPGGSVMTVIVPPTGSSATTAREVQAVFCEFAHFFASREAAQAWRPAERDIAIIGVDDGFRLGQLVYGDLAANPSPS